MSFNSSPKLKCRIDFTFKFINLIYCINWINLFSVENFLWKPKELVNNLKIGEIFCYFARHRCSTRGCQRQKLLSRTMENQLATQKWLSACQSFSNAYTHCRGKNDGCIPGGPRRRIPQSWLKLGIIQSIILVHFPHHRDNTNETGTKRTEKIVNRA